MFYAPPRFVTHIDDGAIAAVGSLYEELGIDGTVLDLMSSWVSHFRAAPARLTVLGMNAQELAANPQAADWVVHDLNADPVLPFADDTFDDAVCCVSVDYLTRPFDVFRDARSSAAARRPFRHDVLEPSLPDQGGAGMAVRRQRCSRRDRAQTTSSGPGASSPRESRLCTPIDARGDPLYAVWATVRAGV